MTRLLRISVVMSFILLAACLLSAQPPDRKIGKKPPGKKPLRSPEDLFQREVEKVWEKVEKQGETFDAQKEIFKLEEKLQREFGTSLPDEAAGEFFRNVDEAMLFAPRPPRDAPPARAREPAKASGKQDVNQNPARSREGKRLRLAQ